MNYFFKELASGNKVYIAGVAAISVWMVALIDAVSSAIDPPGLANGWIFYIAAAGTIVGIIGLALYQYLRDKKKRDTVKTVEEEAALFEPFRESEIREILEHDPHFNTHCYQCLHFEPRVTGCKKQLSKDIAYSRLREVRINNKKYCLYWEESFENSDRV